MLLKRTSTDKICLAMGLDIYKHVVKSWSISKPRCATALTSMFHTMCFCQIPEDLQSRTLGLTNDGGQQCAMPGSGGRFIAGI